MKSPFHTFCHFFSYKGTWKVIFVLVLPSDMPHYCKRKIALTNVNLLFLVWTVFHRSHFQCSELMSLGSLDFLSLKRNPVEHYSWAFCTIHVLLLLFLFESTLSCPRRGGCMGAGGQRGVTPCSSSGEAPVRR